MSLFLLVITRTRSQVLKVFTEIGQLLLCGSVNVAAAFPFQKGYLLSHSSRDAGKSWLPLGHGCSF